MAIQKFFRKPYVSDFKSNYGRIAGPMLLAKQEKYGKDFLPDKYQRAEDID
jgi:hypothetical protein